MKTTTQLLYTLLLMILSLSATAGSKPLEFDVALSDLSVLAGTSHKAYLNINIKGLPNGARMQRPQSNIAFVLDRSGSMSGIKLTQAKQALEMAISRLNKGDVASLVVYDDNAQVLWPAAEMQNPDQLLQIVRNINTGGSTALFAGVTQGSYEVKKFLDRNKVNRVILLSDGMANVGPSKPHELAELGRALIKQGLSVSTIGLGLGYNEDLMTQLAGHSDGNHYFVEDADKLAKVFDSELGDIFSVVAQDININISCRDGVKPIRILGRDETVSGQNINTKFNQIYGNQQRYLTLELMIPPGVSGEKLSVADVNITYNDSISQQKGVIHSNEVAVTFTDSPDIVQKDKNVGIYDNVTSYEANEVSKKVVDLRDQGRVEEAREMQSANISRLNRQMSQSAEPEKLQKQLEEEEFLLESLDESNWNKSRKKVREKQHNIDTQKKIKGDDNNTP